MTTNSDATTPSPPNANKLGKRLWVIMSRAVAAPDEIAKHRLQHLEHQVRLEKAGILFGAGPLSDAQGERVGIGLIIIRAGTAEDARRIADSDPMHISGVRTYTLHQ